MGRPKIPNKRDHQLNIGLTADEFNEIASRAFALAMAPVDYARRLLFGASDGHTRPVPEPARTDRLAVVQLQRLGNLLNQLVRGFHQSGQTAPSDLAPLLQDVRALIRRLLP